MAHSSRALCRRLARARSIRRPASPDTPSTRATDLRRSWSLPQTELRLFSRRACAAWCYSWRGGRAVLGVQNISLPWRQLTTYKATYTDVSTHIRNLTAAPNLVECDIDFGNSGPQLGDILRHDVLVLPNLGRLALSHPPFLARLTAPALESLYLVGAVDPLLPLLQRSRRTEALTSLTLTTCATPVSEIIAILRHTCGLTSFALDLSSPPAELVAALVASERLCPALGSLSFTDWNDELDRDAFVGMIVSRCRGSDSMRALYAVAIYSGRRRMKTAEFRLRALPGLEVLVMNSKKDRLAVRKWRVY
ncbi:hypothetical protein DFH06DRAFT_64157 [Mycena polygramma]|nr:hypothetical protein DFH06DRAFT_64157 [Mycena polygramma]